MSCKSYSRWNWWDLLGCWFKWENKPQNVGLFFWFATLIDRLLDQFLIEIKRCPSPLMHIYIHMHLYYIRTSRWDTHHHHIYIYVYLYMYMHMCIYIYTSKLYQSNWHWCCQTLKVFVILDPPSSRSCRWVLALQSTKVGAGEKGWLFCCRITLWPSHWCYWCY